MPKTLFQKLWDSHIVKKIDDETFLIYIDTHLVHEVTSPQAFNGLRKRGIKVRRRDKTFATCDHNVPTSDQKNIRDELSRLQVEALEKNCKEFEIPLYGLDSPHQGIVHVIGPELGITQPGATIVCGDSHTSTHGAFGTLAFGIGTTEVEQVLATQCLLQSPLKTMEIKIDGKLGSGVTAKDIILTIIRNIGTKGGSGYAIEYTGEAIRNLSMDGRMTICNMSIEAGAKAGMVAADQKTFDYIKGKMFAPYGTNWDKALDYWKSLHTDKGAAYDKLIVINGNTIEPLVTYGTDPSTGIKLSEKIPNFSDLKTPEEKITLTKSLEYMQIKPGTSLNNFPIDYVFIGSCTNSRLSDLREVTNLIKGKKVKSGVYAFVVPGSRHVKKMAEEEGLDKIFISAGFDWRGAGCSACLGMNEDKIPAGKYCVSTSNRNFQGRQGPGARTFLASPLTAAISAIEGKIVDVRNYL
ncbi:3-isopropylmalate dehydratase large subunit [Candidatus Gottesmanbacteria bacterium RIFCSPHIGHO2_02_FULL_39_11]|uniref:3-isopropylmalate dehydratase large subunit n=1 Tax=Candidatus Gottesmanbacteria bacterium RIFCSPHIGHO2_02_FULL_39_11 TaxID=1798382 RepID=A0A1F5ZSU3_9BACT|nr:MAG: 3-isopropylmalate dehydratase large subunit [Candidatus Gottesmanbacteria bacterium RIFCSPHIGHO2_02_FULL_39_11]